MTDDPLLARFAAALAPVPGLAALVLGGSRGRGAAGAHSDYDLGLYYEPEAPLDVAAVGAVDRWRRLADLRRRQGRPALPRAGPRACGGGAGELDRALERLRGVALELRALL